MGKKSSPESIAKNVATRARNRAAMSDEERSAAKAKHSASIKASWEHKRAAKLAEKLVDQSSIESPPSY